MDKTVYLEQIDGLMVEQVVRDQEYIMYSRHLHESYELYFLMSGERYYFIDRETYLVQAGMAVLVSRNQIHKTSVAGAAYHDRLLFQIDGDVFLPYLRLLGFTTMEELFGRLNRVVKYGDADWQEVLRMLEQLKRELEERREGYETAAKMLVMQLLILTLRNRIENVTAERLSLFTPGSYQAQTARHQTIREVTEYLLGHIETNETQEELAARFYVSKSYLCRIFKEVTGVTLNEYLNLTRIKEARQLLTETSVTVTEIAARVGFESITYFERVFKKHTGERPLQYRKNHR